MTGIVRVLIEKGCDPKMVSRRGNASPLYVAIHGEHVSTVEYLLGHIDPRVGGGVGSAEDYYKIKIKNPSSSYKNIKKLVEKRAGELEASKVEVPAPLKWKE